MKLSPNRSFNPVESRNDNKDGKNGPGPRVTLLKWGQLWGNGTQNNAHSQRPYYDSAHLVCCVLASYSDGLVKQKTTKHEDNTTFTLHFLYMFGLQPAGKLHMLWLSNLHGILFIGTWKTSY